IRYSTTAAPPWTRNLFTVSSISTVKRHCILFAFDPKQQAVIILGGSKQADKRWYDTNIPISEKLFFEHLEKLRKADKESPRKEIET
nr:hypothetical protein [Candidatus Obscuribacter sp.]